SGNNGVCRVSFTARDSSISSRFYYLSLLPEVASTVCSSKGQALQLTYGLDFLSIQAYRLWMEHPSRGKVNSLTRRSFLTTSLMAAPAIALASGTFDSKTEQNWPGFRGPGSQGVADGYPTRADWNADAAAGKLSGVL